MPLPVHILLKSIYVDNTMDSQDRFAHWMKCSFIRKKYGAENFDFYDLTAIVKKSWIVDFCRKIEERGLSFTWRLPSGTRTEAIDGEVASLLYRSGCRNMSYSPEGGSPAVLRRIKENPPRLRHWLDLREGDKKRYEYQVQYYLWIPGRLLSM